MAGAILGSGFILSVARPCENVTGTGIITKADCSGWYVCVNGGVIETHDCGPRMVYNRWSTTCVEKGGMYDLCTGKIDEQCDKGARYIPHPTQCQLYYDCSRDRDWTGVHYLAECTYPDLFNSETKSCEPFQTVHCGQRRVIKDDCGYRYHISYDQCAVNLPSCVGLTDGRNPHPFYMWSPFYIVCYKERLIDNNKCPDDPETLVFHPELRKCVTWEKIQQQHGGTMPDCGGETDGFHADALGRCNRYFVCKHERVQGTGKCADNAVFDTVSEVCRPPELSCSPPPCGDPDRCMRNYD